MSTSTIKCPECGGVKTISSGGNKYTCQYCGATFVQEVQTVNINTESPKMMTHCQYCNGEIVYGAKKCRHCGAWLFSKTVHPAFKPKYLQNSQEKYQSSKSKVVAALLCFFLGSLGIHEFYLNRAGAGIAFLFCTIFLGWMVWPLVIIGFICLIQTISYLCMSDQKFAEKYH